MKKLNIIVLVVIFSLIALLSLNSCGDKLLPGEKDEYQPQTGACDTTNVSFSNTLLPLFTGSCSCHVTSSSGGVSLADYAGTKKEVDKGVLINSVIPGGSMHSFVPSQCAQDEITAWVNQGAQNN